MPDRTLLSVLDFLEQREAKLLTWGVTTGGFSEDEILDLIDEHINTHFPEELRTSSDIIEELEEKKLLFRLPSFRFSGQAEYRTRSAETLFLLNSLKQILSFRRRDENSADWRRAPNLVADYRYSLRPRTFPKRIYTKEDVIHRLSEQGTLTDEHEAVLNSLLSDPHNEIKLAEFQVESILHMLQGLNGNLDKGMIVTAGTGSGKTFCFYLPALMHIARVMNKESRTVALAIYPRVELLKDQSTNAYQLVIKLSQTIKSIKGRSLSIGAYFGDTPLDNNWLKRDRNNHWRCDFIKCPVCDGDLYWLDKDIKSNIHVLSCKTPNCYHITPSNDLLKLTKKEITASPPEILFTTTEMLNRLMSDSWSFHIIGLGKSEAPDLLLLDEIHTYSGIHGAQVANLIRRWRFAINKKVYFTGLSATLENPEVFMGDMVGLKEQNIVKLEPKELENIGMEYLVALRGDPISGIALLSATIQTVMLMRRVLDLRDDHESIFGKKVFAFTDDLDVNNRLFHNLLDAEGYVQRNNDTYHERNLPLAVYRRTRLAEEVARYQNGQSWRVPERIGHDLSSNLTIARTSSQDTGVDKEADIIIATASLEVGYDDDGVGAVIQHKSPRDLASFLQRKGRAGRKTTMRPWTIIALSDYGRDRITYQSYEQLFSPVLPEKNLPINNDYVLRIQSALAFFDWLTQKFTKYPKVKLWSEFTYSQKDTETRQSVRKEIIGTIEKLFEVEENGLYQELKQYIANALRLSEDDLQKIFWEQPRPLMTALLPSLYRKLTSNWKAYPDTQEFEETPLPDFIPPSLFSDLNLPEVQILLEGRDAEDDCLFMPIEQALKEFAPGRISRRFSIRSMYQSYWVAVDIENEINQLDINRCFPDKEYLGEFNYRNLEGTTETVSCYRPISVSVDLVHDENINSTSNAFHEWKSVIELPSNNSTYFSKVPEKVFFSKFLQKIGFFTHQSSSQLKVSRFSIGSRATVGIRGPGGEERSITTYFRNQQDNCAMGFSLAVDGLCLTVQIPSDILSRTISNFSILKGLRRAFFKDTFLSLTDLDEIANDFQKDWLQQAFIAALVSDAVSNNCLLPEAFQNIQTAGIGDRMKLALRIFFIEGESEHIQNLSRNHSRLEALCDNAIVLDNLASIASLLWDEPGRNFENWLREVFLTTLGAAIQEACFQLTPNFDSTEITVDIEHENSPILSSMGVDSMQANIWISEKVLGGGGIIESIEEQYQSDPQRFFLLLESALQASDFELADTQLQQILHLVAQKKEDIVEGIDQVRSANTFHDLTKAHEELRKILSENSILIINSFYAALNVRLLRSGSSDLSDVLMHDLLSFWDRFEDRLGIEIDARLFAYIAGQQRTFIDQVNGIVPVEDSFSAIYGLLWPRGHSLRSNAQKLYSPYQSFPPSDRLIVVDYNDTIEVDVEDENWLEKVHSSLIRKAEVTLYSPSDKSSIIKNCLFTLLTTPIEIETLLIYPRVNGVFYEQNKAKVKLILPENVF